MDILGFQKLPFSLLNLLNFERERIQLPLPTTLSSFGTVVEPTTFTRKNDLQTTDLLEKDGHTMTPPIIRPASALSPILSTFPFLKSIVRPRYRFQLDSSTDAFEEELCYVLRLEQHWNDLAGALRRSERHPRSGCVFPTS